MLKSLMTYFPYVLVLAAMGVAIVSAKLAPRRTNPKYITRPLLTENEREFFGRLTRALPDLHVFPQLAMSAIIRPVDSYQRNKAAYWKINRKIVDYTIYTKAMQLVCIIELDDEMHDPIRDAERDRCTASAGIKTLRFESRKKPSEAEIRAFITDIVNKSTAAGSMSPKKDELKLVHPSRSR